MIYRIIALNGIKYYISFKHWLLELEYNVGQKEEYLRHAVNVLTI